MADLLAWGHRDGTRWGQVVDPEGPIFRLLRLYCWQHNEVHEFTLDDVEQIIYALAAGVPNAYGLGADHPEFGHLCEAAKPECPIDTLRSAGDIELFAEHVEQGVECRAAAEQITAPRASDT